MAKKILKNKIVPASGFKKTPATKDTETGGQKFQENFTAGTMASMKKNPSASAGVVTESTT